MPIQASWPMAGFDEQFNQPHPQPYISDPLDPFKADISMSNEDPWNITGQSLFDPDQGQAYVPFGGMGGTFNRELVPPPTKRQRLANRPTKPVGSWSTFRDFSKPFDREASQQYAEKLMADFRRHVREWQEFINMYFDHGSVEWEEHTSQVFVWTQNLDALEKWTNKKRALADEEYAAAIAANNAKCRNSRGKRKHDGTLDNSGSQAPSTKRPRAHDSMRNDPTPNLPLDTPIDPAMMDRVVLTTGSFVSSSTMSVNDSLECFQFQPPLGSEIGADADVDMLNTGDDDLFEQFMESWEDPFISVEDHS